ncbi:MAG: hypothetical protein AAB771_01010 [Patescibacteria group bacterium]
MKFYRQELVNLTKDTEESRLCVKIAGLSLVQTGPLKIGRRIKISDETQEGRDLIKRLIKEGFRVESIKD